MSWIEKRGNQHRVYWRTGAQRGARKEFEPFATRAQAEQFQALVAAMAGDVAAAREYIRRRDPVPLTSNPPAEPTIGGGLAPAATLDPGAGVVTLDVMFERYLDLKVCRPYTLEGYRKLYENHIAPYFGGDRDITTIRNGRYLDPRQPARVTGGDSGDTVTVWLKWLGRRHKLTNTGKPSSELLSAKTIRSLHGLLSGTLEVATLIEPEPIIARNPCRASKLPEVVPTEMHFLERGGLEALLEQLSGVWQLLVLFLACTGLRFGEAAGLNCGDVFLDAEKPHVAVRRAWARGPEGSKILGLPKTMSSIRKVTVPDLLIPALRELVGDRYPASPLFRMPRGGRLHHGNVLLRYIRPAIESAAEASPLVPAELRIHDLRHSHASWLIAQGTPITDVARRLGHASILTTQRYVHALAGMDSAAAAAIDAYLCDDLPELTEPVRLAMVDPALPILDIDDDDDLAA